MSPRRRKVTALGLVFLASLIGAAVALETTQLKKESFRAPVHVSVEGNITLNNSGYEVGVSADQNFDYGDLPLGSNITKFVGISSNGTALVGLEATGNVSEYLKYQKEYMISGKKRIRVEFAATEPGYFEGWIRFTIQKPRTGLGGLWLDLKHRFF